MNDDRPLPPAPPAPPASHAADGGMGASLLLSGIALWLALLGFWVQRSTYERYRHRTDLDMPDWFAINLDLTFKVVPLGALAGLLDFVAVCLLFGWVGRATWLTRIGFMVQWLASVAIVGLLFWSRSPASMR